MLKVKMFVVLAAMLAILAGLINGTAQTAVVSDDCNLTATQLHENDLSHLDQLVHSGYTLTNRARLIQAGVALKSTKSISASLLATKSRDRTLAMQPPQVEDGGSGGYGAQTWYPLSMYGTNFSYGIRVNLNCGEGRGGEAWTGSPPGDRQAAIAVNNDGSVSNPATAGCPWYAYSNCMYQWVATPPQSTSVNYIWISGLYTYPMFIPGWTHCW